MEGTPSAYLWTPQGQGLVNQVDHTDHYYSIDSSHPQDYTLENGNSVFLLDSSLLGTVPLDRFFNSSTGHHYYSTSEVPPAGFTLDGTVGHVYTDSGLNLVVLYRYHNPTTGDYLIDNTSKTPPPSGYQLEATLGYVRASNQVVDSLQALSYKYDNVGNITDITDGIFTGTRHFEYDNLNRLIEASGTFGGGVGIAQEAVTETYEYDDIGNFLVKAGVSYLYEDINHPSRVTSTTNGKNYTYDANGNMLTAGNRTQQWDFDNRLATVEGGPGGRLDMTYDYTGLRVTKQVNLDFNQITTYPFSGYEIDNGGVITKYIRTGNEIFASKKGSVETGEKLFYHNDHLGGVNILSNEVGISVQVIEYDPWGRVSREEGSGDSIRRFTGQQLDSDSGLYYYGGRYYGAELGRFISPDPFVQDPDSSQNLNRYSYVINNPQYYIDPTGYSHRGDGYEIFCGGGWEWWGWGGGRIFDWKRDRIATFKDIAREYGIRNISYLATQTEIYPKHLQPSVNTGSPALSACGPGNDNCTPGFNFSDLLILATHDDERKIFPLGPPGGKRIGNRALGRKWPRAPKGGYDVLERKVLPQLKHPRLHDLAGKLTVNQVQQMASDPIGGIRIFNRDTGNYNVYYEVFGLQEGDVLRITIAGDESKIISVGPERFKAVKKRLSNGQYRFVDY